MGCQAEVPTDGQPQPITRGAVVKLMRRWGFVLVETGGPGDLDRARAETLRFSDRLDSIRSYYREVSYGLQDLGGEVLGPVTFDASSVGAGLCASYAAV